MARLLKGPSSWLVQHAVGGPAWPEAQPRTRVRVAVMSHTLLTETQKPELWERKRDIGLTVKGVLELVVVGHT